MTSIRKPARDITKSHHGKNLFYFPSRKNNCQLICESQLEADLCILLEHNKSVISYECQPETLHLLDLGPRRSYTPDFLIRTEHGCAYIEVKPDWSKLPNYYLEKILAAKSLLERRGHKLLLVDEISIRESCKLKNLQILYSRSFNSAPTEYSDFISKLQTLNKRITLGQLLSCLPNTSPSTKYLAIFNEDFNIELNKPISLSTLLEVKR